MNKKYQLPDIPRFTAEEGEALGRKAAPYTIVTGLTFQKLWDERESATLLPLEESAFARWTWGRIACVGDTTHKVRIATPMSQQTFED